MPPPSKRAKRQPTSAAPAIPRDSAQDNTPCYLLRLPLEILAEILRYVRLSELLSLARTSKYFCRILCDPGSSFLWKRARMDPDLLFVIPDPPPNMAEPAYAATIFDPGKCYVCQKETNKLFHSYAYRARLCSKVRGFATPHNVSTEKNVFSRRVQGIGINISHRVSLPYRICKLCLNLFLVVLSSVLVAANLLLSRSKLSSSGRYLRKPMILYCILLHSVGQSVWIPWRRQGTSRVSSHIYGDTFDVSSTILL